MSIPEQKASTRRSKTGPLVAALPVRKASRTIIDLLWLAHEYACEAELTITLDQIHRVGDLPDPSSCRRVLDRKRERPRRISRSIFPLQMSFSASILDKASSAPIRSAASRKNKSIHGTRHIA